MFRSCGEAHGSVLPLGQVTGLGQRANNRRMDAELSYEHLLPRLSIARFETASTRELAEFWKYRGSKTLQISWTLREESYTRKPPYFPI